jgi:hypothetical protein
MRVFNARGGQVSEKGEKREHEGGGLGHRAAIFETIKAISSGSEGMETIRRGMERRRLKV